MRELSGYLSAVRGVVHPNEVDVPKRALRSRPHYAVGRYDVGSLEVRLGYATWRRGRVELCQKLRLMAL